MKVICPKCGSNNNKIVNTNRKGAPRYKYKCNDCPKLFEEGSTQKKKPNINMLKSIARGTRK